MEDKEYEKIEEMKEAFFEILYTVKGIEGIKDFVLFSIKENKERDKSLISLFMIFESMQKKIKQEDKTAYNALVKVWLDELEKELRLE